MTKAASAARTAAERPIPPLPTDMPKQPHSRKSRIPGTGQWWTGRLWRSSIWASVSDSEIRPSQRFDLKAKITRKRCIELLVESSLIKAVSEILSSHSLKINGIHVDDLMGIPLDENETLEKNRKAELPYLISVEIFLDICCK